MIVRRAEYRNLTNGMVHTVELVSDLIGGETLYGVSLNQRNPTVWNVRRDTAEKRYAKLMVHYASNGYVLNFEVEKE